MWAERDVSAVRVARLDRNVCVTHVIRLYLVKMKSPSHFLVTGSLLLLFLGLLLFVKLPSEMLKKCGDTLSQRAIFRFLNFLSHKNVAFLLFFVNFSCCFLRVKLVLVERVRLHAHITLSLERRCALPSFSTFLGSLRSSVKGVFCLRH